MGKAKRACLRIATRSAQLAVALLVFLARPTGTGFIAPDLPSLTLERCVLFTTFLVPTHGIGAVMLILYLRLAAALLLNSLDI